MLFLYFVMGCVAIALLVAVYPTKRNILTAVLGIIGCVAAAIGAIFFTEKAIVVVVGIGGLALLWALWWFLGWPFRAVLSMLSRD